MRMRHKIPLTLLLASTVLPATAQDRPASTDSVYACAAIEADDARLDCYDEAVGALKQAEDAGEVVAVTREDVEKVRKESFGFSIPSLPGLAASAFGDAGETESLTVPVAEVDQVRGQFVVTLENGQVWRQTDSKDVFYSAKRGVNEATIKSAALGSYMMKFDRGVLVRVERVK